MQDQILLNSSTAVKILPPLDCFFKIRFKKPLAPLPHYFGDRSRVEWAVQMNWLNLGAIGQMEGSPCTAPVFRIFEGDYKKTELCKC